MAKKKKKGLTEIDYGVSGKELWKQHLKEKGDRFHHYDPNGHRFELNIKAESVTEEETRDYVCKMAEKMKQVFGYRPWMSSFITDTGQVLELVHIELKERIKIEGEEETHTRKKN